ncbi:hypothetical protein GGR25_002256 [Kaistia hirudinis]|uniref:Uncharacterized protein n=1 Tax=Kaistia hirudinis TaxID=1293440 RepID=A0A840AS58_9HYPH|nr:hypothetical protein [Kaistia hirudinis]MBB3931206.1 hypothetical protein [Kaistia hirudinis]
MMQALEAAKGATAETVNALREDLAWRRLVTIENNASVMQAQRLADRFGFLPERAAVIALHAFGEARA